MTTETDAPPDLRRSARLLASLLAILAYAALMGVFARPLDIADVLAPILKNQPPDTGLFLSPFRFQTSPWIWGVGAATLLLLLSAIWRKPGRFYEKRPKNGATTE